MRTPWRPYSDLYGRLLGLDEIYFKYDNLPAEAYEHLFAGLLYRVAWQTAWSLQRSIREGRHG